MPMSARESENQEQVRLEADAYAPPRLRVYGMVQDLTSSGGRIGKNDRTIKRTRTGF